MSKFVSEIEKPWHLGPVPPTCPHALAQCFIEYAAQVGEPHVLDLGLYDTMQKANSAVLALGLLLLAPLLLSIIQLQRQLRFLPATVQEAVTLVCAHLPNAGFDKHKLGTQIVCRTWSPKKSLS